MGKTIGIVVAVLVVLGAAGYFYMQSNQAKPGETVVQNSPAAAVQASPEGAASSPSTEVTEEGTVKEFTVTNAGFKFNPSEMTVNKGDTVRVTFTSSGSHDWAIDEFDARTEVLANGDSETIEFV